MEDIKQQSNPEISSASPIAQDGANATFRKKNWGKWILICVVIGLLVSFSTYYFFFSKQEANNYTQSTPVSSSQPTEARML